MKRLQITILERQVEEMDRLIGEGEYTSKSEIIRYALKEMLRVEKVESQGEAFLQSILKIEEMGLE